ncbi:MAG: zinc-ribbon domain-containing protein, partial [Myxococcota bacterium]|nr:zinc-ribbon domain-containing protein [Myxococcota bacterium]
MSACPHCGTVARPTDRFCNVCGTPVPRPSSQPGSAAAHAHGAPPAPFATPPPPP